MEWESDSILPMTPQELEDLLNGFEPIDVAAEAQDNLLNETETAKTPHTLPMTNEKRAEKYPDLVTDNPEMDQSSLLVTSRRRRRSRSASPEPRKRARVEGDDAMDIDEPTPFGKWQTRQWDLFTTMGNEIMAKFIHFGVMIRLIERITKIPRKSQTNRENLLEHRIIEAIMANNNPTVNLYGYETTPMQDFLELINQTNISFENYLAQADGDDFLLLQDLEKQQFFIDHLFARNIRLSDDFELFYSLEENRLLGQKSLSQVITAIGILGLPDRNSENGYSYYRFVRPIMTSILSNRVIKSIQEVSDLETTHAPMIFKINSFFCSPIQWSIVYPEKEFRFPTMMDMLLSCRFLTFLHGQQEHGERKLDQLARIFGRYQTSLDDYVAGFLEDVLIDLTLEPSQTFYDFLFQFQPTAQTNEFEQAYQQEIVRLAQSLRHQMARFSALRGSFPTVDEKAQGNYNNHVTPLVKQQLFYKMAVDLVMNFVQIRGPGFNFNTLGEFLFARSTSQKHFEAWQQQVIEPTICFPFQRTAQYQPTQTKKDDTTVTNRDSLQLVVMDKPEEWEDARLLSIQMLDVIYNKDQKQGISNLCQMLLALINNHAPIFLHEVPELALRWSIMQVVDKTAQIQLMQFLVHYLFLKLNLKPIGSAEPLMHPFFYGQFGGSISRDDSKKTNLANMTITPSYFPTPFLKYPYHIHSLYSPTFHILFPNEMGSKKTETIHSMTKIYYDYLREHIDIRNHFLLDSLLPRFKESEKKTEKKPSSAHNFVSVYRSRQVRQPNGFSLCNNLRLPCSEIQSQPITLDEIRHRCSKLHILANELFLGANAANELVFAERTQHLRRDGNYLDFLREGSNSYFSHNFGDVDDKTILPQVAGQLFKETLRTVLSMQVASSYFSTLTHDLARIQELPELAESDVITWKAKPKKKEGKKLRPFLSREEDQLKKRYQVITTLTEEWTNLEFNVSQFVTFEPLRLLLVDMNDKKLDSSTTDLEVVIQILEAHNSGFSIYGQVDSYEQVNLQIQQWKDQWKTTFDILTDLRTFLFHQSRGQADKVQVSDFSTPLMQLRHTIGAASDIIAHLNVHFYTLWYSSVFGLPLAFGPNKSQYNPLVQHELARNFKKGVFNNDDYLSRTLALLVGSCNDLDLKHYGLYRNFTESLQEPGEVANHQKITKDDALEYFLSFIENKQDYAPREREKNKNAEYIEKLRNDDKRRAGYVRIGSILWILHILKHAMKHFGKLFHVFGRNVAGDETIHLSPFYMLAQIGSVQTFDDWRYRQWVNNHHKNVFPDDQPKSASELLPRLTNSDAMIVPLEPLPIAMGENIPIGQYASRFLATYKQARNLPDTSSRSNIIFSILQDSSAPVAWEDPNSILQSSAKQRTIYPMSKNSKDYFAKTKDLKKSLVETVYPFSDDEMGLQNYFQMTAGMSINCMETMARNEMKPAYVHTHTVHPTLLGHNSMSHLLQLHLFANNMLTLLPEYIATLASWITEDNVGVLGNETPKAAVEYQRKCIQEVISEEEINNFNMLLNGNNWSFRAVVSNMIDSCQ